MRFLIGESVVDTSCAVRSWRRKQTPLAGVLYLSRKGRYYEVRFDEHDGPERATFLTPEEAVRWLLVHGFDGEIPTDLEPLVLGQME